MFQLHRSSESALMQKVALSLTKKKKKVNVSKHAFKVMPFRFAVTSYFGCVHVLICE